MEQSAAPAQPVQDWRPPDLRAWLAKDSLAAALGLSPLSDVQVPMWVNVFTVGLEDGAGGGGVSLSSDMLREWLSSLEHLIPQAVIPSDVSALETPTNEEEIEHSSSVRHRRRSHSGDTTHEADTDAAPNDPAALRISYRYHLRLVKLSPQVLPALERFLAVHHRIESAPQALYQVDAEIISAALEGLVEHLKLDESERTHQKRAAWARCAMCAHR